MNGCMDKLGQRFNHKIPHIPQHSPYRYIVPKKVYGPASQDTILPDETSKLDEEKIKLAHQAIGVCVYYSRVIDDTILPTLSDIAIEQSEAIKRTIISRRQGQISCLSNDA